MYCECDVCCDRDVRCIAVCMVTKTLLMHLDLHCECEVTSYCGESAILKHHEFSVDAMFM